MARYGTDVAAGLAALAISFAAVNAQPLSGEFQVNTFEDDEQDDPAVGVAPDGSFVVAWESFEQIGTGNEVYFQRYDAGGNPLGGETRVNQLVNGAQGECDIAVQAEYFVITWESPAIVDGGSRDVVARVYNSDGTPRTDEFVVNAEIVGVRECPKIAAHPGGFTIAWEGPEPGVFHRVYDSSGNPLTGAIQANAITDGNQDDVDISMDANGNFALAWKSDPDADGSGDIRARRFNADGSPRDDTEFLVNQTTEGNQERAAIGMDARGRFTVAWEGPEDPEAENGSAGVGVFARCYDADGQPETDEFKVSAFEPGDQGGQRVARNELGFIITWESHGGQDGDDLGVYSRIFGPDCVPRGNEGRINVTTAGAQEDADVAVNASGDIVVAWEGSDGGTARAGSEPDAVFARRYAPGTLQGGHRLDRMSASEKGSLLAYADVEVRWENAPPYNVIQDTFVHITNDYPDGVDVKMHFVNGDAPIFAVRWEGDAQTEDGGDVLSGRMSAARSTGDENGGAGHGGGGEGGRDHPGWNWVGNVIMLTANEPAHWAASTGLPKGVSRWDTLDPGPPPGRPDPDNPSERHLRGYILAFAVDPVRNEEIRWNHLAGDATVVNYSTESAWKYNAYSYAVTNGTAHGRQSGTPGHLALDGTEYAHSFAQLLMNFVASGSNAYSGENVVITHDTDLTLAPTWWDHRQETDGPGTVKVSFDIWNENEVKFTNLDRCITCWDQELLSNHAIPNHFLIESLHTNAGKARMDGLTSQLCPGSRAAPLLGVAQKVLGFHAASGNNLVGLGTEAGMLWHDTSEAPPESNWIPRTPEEVPGFIDRFLESVK